MADVKFTPGEWSWQQGKAGNADQWCLEPGVLLVDGTDGTPGGDSIDRANAHLMASSPDGYALAETIIGFFTAVRNGSPVSTDRMNEIWTQAEVYLCKARGHQQEAQS